MSPYIRACSRGSVFSLFRGSVLCTTGIFLLVLGGCGQRDSGADVSSASPIGSEAGADPVAEVSDWRAALESASSEQIERGRTLFQMCAGCHGIAEDEMSPAGPSLHLIAGRRVGGLDGYPYTQALVRREEYWTIERFNGFIASPQDAYPGTGMAYSGVKKEEDRNALIAYVASRVIER